MQNNFKYINLSWAVVGICENPHQPLSSCIPSIEEDKAAAVEHYVIGYMAFWHIAFVDEDCLVPCNDDALRNDAQQQIDHISQLGIDEGIDLRYATTLYTNTRDAHRLTKLAQTKHDAALEDR